MAGPELSLRLEQVLQTIQDRAFAERLRVVYIAAARAVVRLGDMDLLKYETTTVEGSPDLSLWEQMAPVIRDTVMDVNALLTVLRQQFPPPPPGGLADAIRQTLAEAAPLVPRRGIAEAEGELHTVAGQLAQEITALGERVRRPSVVSDRWNLLADIQMFRTKFRETIGDLVYRSATAFMDLRRAEVVPGFGEELKAAVNVRAAVADLIRLIATRIEEVEEAEPEDVQWHAQHLQRDLDTFGQTPAYKVLRAQDKRVVIEFRQALGKVARRENASKPELMTVLRPFAEFVQSLQAVNQREILVAHDREVWAACGVKLEQAQQLASGDALAAATLLEEAAHTAMELYGRAPALDEFLCRFRKGQLAGLTGAALQQQLDAFRERLASLQIVG
jgi:hypothetical protein